ncbi:hypothetical protein AgCh_019980 [Apium graveolens]
MVDQSSIKFSIEDFYIAGVDSINAGAKFNQSIIYFKLDIANEDERMGIYYDNINLTFSYYKSGDHIVPVANYAIQGFRQGANKETDRKDYVVTTRGITWQQISNNVSVLSLSPSVSSDVVFRVDLATAVRFREVFTATKSKRLQVMAWCKVEVDQITGKKVSKKAIKLKHLIKNHVSGWVIFVFVIMIVPTILSPCSGFLCFAGCSKLMSRE